MSDSVVLPNVRILQLSLDALCALADADLSRARAFSSLPLTDWFVSPAARDTWQMRAQQVREQPRDRDWVTGVILDVSQHLAVGKAGFHAAPDRTGLVEVGYAIDPLFRRRGYARAALVAMLARAQAEQCVRTVRASISPDNTASRALVASFGFVVVGEQWDERDGLELIHERSS